jgi:hypothetical protein
VNLPKQLSVRGIVTAIDWDEKGNATRVALMTRDEEEFELDASGAEHSRLLDLPRCEVVALGSLGPIRHGRRILRVATIAIID